MPLVIGSKNIRETIVVYSESYGHTRDFAILGMVGEELKS